MKRRIRVKNQLLQAFTVDVTIMLRKFKYRVRTSGGIVH